MNERLKDLYNAAGDAVEPAGDVNDILARAGRRRTTTRVVTPLATAAVVAGTVGAFSSLASQPQDRQPTDAEQVAAAVPDTAEVTGHTYVADGDTSSKAPAKLELDFKRGGYSATAGCNTFTGHYRIQDGTLTAKPLSSTAAFCPGKAAKSDRWLDSFLTSGPEVRVVGDALRLNNGKVEVELTQKRTHDAPLADTDWTLEATTDGTGDSATVLSVPNQRSYALHYDGSGALEVNARCFNKVVDADVSDRAISVAEGFGWSGQSRCSGDDVDRTVRDVLDGSAEYVIDGDQLLIKGEENALIYVAN